MRPILGVLLLSATVVAASVRAQDNSSTVVRFKNSTLEQTEKSLVRALESNSPGMHASAAQTIRELKTLMPAESFSCFVVPLMRIVKDEHAERCTRILAALALHDLHSARGDFAIARTALFTDCPRLKQLCSWLTYYRFREVHPENTTLQATRSTE